jgi:ADP-ribosylglycohydrolase
MILNESEPYGGKTNGSAMRVSPVAWAVDTLEDVERLAKWSAEITHSHPEGIKGAQAVASAIFLARTGSTKQEIKNYIESKYYDLDFTVDEIRPYYHHDMTCEGSVPQAIVCFLDSTDFEDAVRNAVSLGGDGDTQACIAGSIAEAFYGIPEEIQEEVFKYIDDNFQEYYWEYAGLLYEQNL